MNNPLRLTLILAEHLKHLTLKHFAPTTLSLRSVHITSFITWCSRTGIQAEEEITRTVIEEYQRYLFEYRMKGGKPQCTSTQVAQLSSLRTWVRWMLRNHIISDDPFLNIEFPKVAYRLPQVLNIRDAELVLQQPSLKTLTGIRDRAILETFYSTGVRRSELVQLKLHDLDWPRELLFIRQGKGRKDRVIPIGERALGWIDRYLWQVRPKLTGPLVGSTVFLTFSGRPFTLNHLSGLARSYIQKVRPESRGACHVFRHTMATLMLEGGADIRFIQQMLGHSKLSTTQIYAHVSIRALKEVHTRTHPGARL